MVGEAKEHRPAKCVFYLCPMGHMWANAVMNTARNKIVNLPKALWPVLFMTRVHGCLVWAL